jgi:hypothetical protein
VLCIVTPNASVILGETSAPDTSSTPVPSEPTISATPTVTEQSTGAKQTLSTTTKKASLKIKMSVSAKGKICAKKAGIAYIKVKAGGQTGKIKVVVKKQKKAIVKNREKQVNKS